jgi:hypothetical protein
MRWLAVGALGGALVGACSFDTSGVVGGDGGATVDAVVPGPDSANGLQRLTVSRGGDGAGTVTSDPAGIDCGGDCIEDFPEGSVVSLQAAPDPLSTFMGWSGACAGTGPCSVTLDAPTLVTATFATAGGELWAERVGGPGQQSAGNDTAVSPAGEVFVTGVCAGAIDFGGGALADRGGNDVCIARFSAAGAHVWSKRHGGTGDDRGLAIALDADGDVYVTGTFTSVGGDFGGMALSSAGLEDVFVVKLDGDDGALRWAKRYGDGGAQSGNGIAVSLDDANVVLVGNFTGSIDFGMGQHVELGASDMFVAWLAAADGITVWSRAWGSTGSETARSVAVDSMGHLLVVGGVSGTVSFGGGITTTATGSMDVGLVKITPLGAVLWAFARGGAGFDYADDVATSGMDLVVIGQYVGAANLGAGPLPTTGTQDVFVARYDPAGAAVWTDGYGGSGIDVGASVAVSPADGTVVVTGTSGMGIDLGNGTRTGASQAFVAKFAPTGSWIWDHVYGSPAEENGIGVAVDASGHVAVTGSAVGVIDFGGGALDPIGARDLVVARLRP